jgi:hypothetical protein
MSVDLASEPRAQATGQPNRTWQTQPAKWEPFKVVDQPAITVEASESGPEILGALLVEVLDHRLERSSWP